MKTLMTITLLTLMAFAVGCVQKMPAPQPAPPTPETGQEFTVNTMVTGIDQFDGGAVWGLNTGHGVFVVGPEVPGGVKATVYEHLMDARDRVITIHYKDMPAAKGIVAHKRVTALIIEDREYHLDY